MEIRRYVPRDEPALMSMLEAQGEEWACYWAAHQAEKYKRNLNASITYVATDGADLCGYSRSIQDGDFYIYVCDLLVTPCRRGMGIGRALMECICRDFPDFTVYVMSDVDGYYDKLGYRREGSVFEVKAGS